MPSFSVASLRLVVTGAAVAMACAAACSASSDDTGFGEAGGGTASGATASGAGGATSSSGVGGLSVASGVGGSGNAGTGGCAQNIDIVFVMDVSTSMGPFLTKLAQEMPAVDNAVKALNLTSPPHYGLVVFVDDILAANTAKPYADVASLQGDFQSWASFTSSNTQVNGACCNSTWPENSIDALYEAATKFEWRPIGETLRIVIHTTDDTFWNGPTTADGVQIVHDYKGTVQALQQAQVRVFSFAALIGGELRNLDVSMGWFGPFMGDKSIPDATGGGVFKLDDVLAGTTSLSASINQAVKDSFCEPYPPPS